MGHATYPVAFFVLAKKFYLADSEKLIQECLYQAGRQLYSRHLSYSRAPSNA